MRSHASLQKGCLNLGSASTLEGLWKAGPGSVIGVPLKFMSFFFLIKSILLLWFAFVYGVCVRAHNSVLWSHFSLSCLHGGEHGFTNTLHPSPTPHTHFSLSYRRKDPTDLPRAPGVLGAATAARLCAASMGPAPALHTYATAHTWTCCSEASTGHTCQGSTPHLSCKGVLLLGRARWRALRTPGRVSCAVFLSCFVFPTSPAPWGLGRMRPQLSL